MPKAALANGPKNTFNRIILPCTRPTPENEPSDVQPINLRMPTYIFLSLTIQYRHSLYFVMHIVIYIINVVLATMNRQME